MARTQIAAGIDRVARSGATRLARRFARDTGAGASCEAHARRLIDASGSRLERVLKTREDGRGVFLVTHPDWGLSVLKTSHALSDPGAGLRNLHLAGLAASSGAPFFPRLHRATADYTLEEYIDGTPLRRWLERDPGMGPVRRFLDELRDWGGGRGPWEGGATLSPEEVRLILHRYVRKCIAQSGYLPPRRKLAAVLELFRRRDGIAQDIDWLMRRAGSIALPRGMMCGDLSNVNLVVDGRRGRLFVVDYEFMSPGHVGFDCAYLLTSLEKIETCPEATRRIAAHVHAPAFLGSDGHAEFFAVLNRVLTTISRSVYGHQPGTAAAGSGPTLPAAGAAPPQRAGS